MLQSLRIWPLLQGYRGRPAVDVERLIDVIVRFSWLVASSPELSELEINPLLATASAITALDARGARQDPTDKPSRPFGHLAIRPYPDEFTASRLLRDGTPVVLRPVRPEDEPLWRELLATCSPETIHARFGFMFREMTHEAATRYCFLDYDRELAIVAEVYDHGRRRLIALGQLLADPNHESAEFSVLIGDAWQEQGLGLAVTEFCLKAAAEWGLKQVEAVTQMTNTRMMSAFRELGFKLTPDYSQPWMRAVRLLPPSSTRTQ